MQVTVSVGRAVGTIEAPPSKSMAHRLLIAAALANGESRVRGISPCEDVAATLDCLQALGARYTCLGNDVLITGIDPKNAEANAPLYCRESGSTLRFLLPIAWLSSSPATLLGAPYLMQRPMDVYESVAKDKHLTFEKDGEGIHIKGPITAGEYTVAGNISSQFISGLLFTLPILEGDSTIHILPPIESRSYLDLTIAALAEFGVFVEWQDDTTLSIRGGQTYYAHDTAVEGDYSGAAFLEALNVLGGQVTVIGLNDRSLQGDRVYREYFAALKKGKCEISIEDCPDLGPILFAVAAANHGGVFHGTRRLRLKESDRAVAMAKELSKLGGRVTVDENSVTIERTTLHAPTEPICSHNDHRVVMSMAVLLTLTGGVIEGAEAVSKSFPDFFERLSSLGIQVKKS